MTTIAYRNGLMAADRQMTTGDVSPWDVRKIWKRRDGAVIAGCGSAELVEKYAKWFIAGEKGFPPDLGKSEDHDADMVIAFPGKPLELRTRFGRTTFEGPYYATGSGQDFALGALAVGATAKEAVAAAARHDIRTGRRIQSLKVG